MIYKVHFNIPYDTYYDGLYLPTAMQEYEGQLVVITEKLKWNRFRCKAYNWHSQTDWSWLFHTDWLIPYYNQLNINLL